MGYAYFYIDLKKNALSEKYPTMFLRFTDLEIDVHKSSDQVSVMHCLAHIWCARIPTAY